MPTTSEFKFSRHLREITVTLTYEDATAALLFSLPNLTRIVDIVFNVKTAFAGGTGTASIGTSSSANEIVSGQDVSAAGKAALTTALADPGHKTAALTDIYGVVGAGNTAGEVDVTFIISLPAAKVF